MPEWLGNSFLKPYGIEKEDLWRFYSGMLLRWHRRVKQIQNKADICEIESDDWDCIFAYFIFCYHLRDWLIVSLPYLQNDIDTWIKDKVEIQICQDICNGLKHGALNRPKRDANFNIYREYDHFAEECAENPTKYCVASIGDDGQLLKYDLFEFVDRCKLVWQDFLESHSLIIPPDKEQE